MSKPFSKKTMRRQAKFAAEAADRIQREMAFYGKDDLLNCFGALEGLPPDVMAAKKAEVEQLYTATLKCVEQAKVDAQETYEWLEFGDKDEAEEVLTNAYEQLNCAENASRHLWAADWALRLWKEGFAAGKAAATGPTEVAA
jgi:hypothetical protein